MYVQLNELILKHHSTDRLSIITIQHTTDSIISGCCDEWRCRCVGTYTSGTFENSNLPRETPCCVYSIHNGEGDTRDNITWTEHYIFVLLAHLRNDRHIFCIDVSDIACMCMYVYDVVFIHLWKPVRYYRYTIKVYIIWTMDGWHHLL